MARKIPVHYIKEDSELDAEVVHLTPTSDRWNRLNGFEPHVDDCFTIVVVAKGSGTTEIDFHTVALSAGEIGIIAPGQVHCNISVRECEAWMLRISPEMMDNDYRNLIDEYSVAGNGAIALTVDDMTILCDAMELLSRLTTSMSSGGGMKSVVFNMLNVILGIVTPKMISGSPKPFMRTREIAVKFKHMVMQHVRQHKRPLYYAGQLCISEVYLNEAVKKSTGMTPSGWINAAMMLEAKRLLRSTSMTVKEIAHELGFEDHTYFSRVFKRSAGVTPLEFRRAILK